MVPELLEACEVMLESGPGPRFSAFMRQLAIEAIAIGDVETALEQLRNTVNEPAFVDTDWMERCPALDSIRKNSDFRPLLAQVR